MNHPIFEEVAKIPGFNSDFFHELFVNASEVLLDSIKIVNIRKGNRFVTADDELDKIRILLSGKVKAMEEYITGDIYIFTGFDPPEIFGETEALGGFPRFRASLVAETDCICATIPVAAYIQFLRGNSEILFGRVRAIIKRSSNNERNNRFYLMLGAKDRIKLFFIHNYRQNQNDDLCMLKITRQQIADETGYSVKTVNRIIKKLMEEKMINTTGQKILITKEQCRNMLNSIDEKANYLERTSK